MATRYATSNLDGCQPGTLRHAVMEAEPGDTIICQWPLDLPLTLAEPLLIRTDRLTIVGYGRIVRFGYGFLVVSDQVDIQMFSFDHVAGDAIMVDGLDARCCTIRGCVFVGGNPDEDEAVSVVRGAGHEWVSLVGCTVRNYYKVILVGTGDAEYKHVELDAKIRLEGCILMDNCRRHPRIRYGHAVLKDCTIAYWGAIWKDFCAGVQADDGAVVELVNCTFKQRIRYMLRPIKLFRDLLAGGGPFRAVVRDASSTVTGNHRIHWRW